MSQSKILFVCTANICRSPTAEVLARARFGEEKALFRSAGFLQSGVESSSTLKGVLADRQISVDNHRSHELDEDTMNAADLLLVMEGRHIQQLTVLHRPALSKAVPLRQAAEIVANSQRPTSLPELVASLEDRDLSEYLSTKWDVSDPYGQSKRKYRRMVAEVDDLVGTVIGSLVPK